METLVNAGTAQEHWAKALALEEFLNALPAEKRKKLDACLNLFCLARSFYSDAAYSGYEGEARLYHLGGMASLFRAAFVDLAQTLGGNNDHRSRTLALDKLCAVTNWLKSKGLTIGDVCRETDRQTRTWAEVAPPRFVSTIIATYAEYHRQLSEDRKQEEAKKKAEEEKKKAKEQAAG